MLKANAGTKRLVDVGGNHVAESVVVGIAEHLECGRSAGRTEEAMNRCEVGIVGGLMEELHELAERLMDKKKVA